MLPPGRLIYQNIPTRRPGVGGFEKNGSAGTMEALMNRIWLVVCVLVLSQPFDSRTCGALPQDRDKPHPGYDDTPQLPGQAWKVHDSKRPDPTVVKPGAEPSKAPSDAVVLFDGGDLSKWKGAWRVVEGAIEVVGGKGDLVSTEEFGDCQLHIEWCVPKGKGQGGGNSGVFLMGRYEIQVLDSFENVTYADGSAGAIYGQHPPRVNACRKPGEWQSFDIVFEAPRFKEGKIERAAVVTVLHNGVVIHHHAEILGQTAHRAVATYAAHGEKGPVRLQDHGDAVRYRNIWVRPLARE
jgi:hypothetical protein